MNTKATTQSTTAPAMAPTNPTPVKKDQPLLANIQSQVQTYIDTGRIWFPEDFNLANAFISAKIALIDLGVINVNGDPTGACSQTSLVNAMFDSLVQGMNVGKDQGYFINYGKVLNFQRSYYGDEALAIRVSKEGGTKPGIEPYKDVVYDGETLTTKKVLTSKGWRRVIVDHTQPFPRKENAQILAAYWGYVDKETGEDMGIELMEMSQIKESWKKSKTYNINSKTFHNEQPDRACIRTVTRRATGPIWKTSADPVLMSSLKRQDAIQTQIDLDVTEGEVIEDVAANANTKELPAAIEPRVDQATGEVQEQPTGEAKLPF